MRVCGCPRPKKGPRGMDTITSLHDLRAALPELAAEARARSTEFEVRRSLPPDFADRLKRAGVFKILVPDDGQGLRRLAIANGSISSRRCAESDASTGWVSAHAGMCAGLICASAEPRFREEFFADPGACAAWSNRRGSRSRSRRTESGSQEAGASSRDAPPPRSSAEWCLLSTAEARRRAGGGAGARRRRDHRGNMGPGGPRRDGQSRRAFRRVFVPWHRTFPGRRVVLLPPIRRRFSSRAHGSSRSAPPPRISAWRAGPSMRRGTSCAARRIASPGSRSSSTRPHNEVWRQPKGYGSHAARACARRWPRCGKEQCSDSPRLPNCA